MTIEVFKTNMQCPDIAQSTILELKSLFPAYTLSFDLEDCDRVLKVAAAEGVANDSILEFFRSRNYMIEVLV